jgi:hypothetical protein
VLLLTAGFGLESANADATTAKPQGSWIPLTPEKFVSLMPVSKEIEFQGRKKKSSGGFPLDPMNRNWEILWTWLQDARGVGEDVAYGLSQVWKRRDHDQSNEYEQQGVFHQILTFFFLHKTLDQFQHDCILLFGVSQGFSDPPIILLPSLPKVIFG